MKLHRITFTHKDGGNRFAYASSETEASKMSTKLKAEHGGGKPTREPIEVPTGKDALLEWLNENAVHAE